MRRRYLLDTNHLAKAINPVSPLRERLLRSHRGGTVIGTCFPVLAEVEAGVQTTAVPDAYRRALETVLGYVRVWPLERPVARHFGEIYVDLRRRGRSLSHVDIVLAALSRHMGVTLLTTDRDFEALPDLRTEDWVTGAPGS